MAVHKTLIYFADPMCSWCWGFSSIIEKVVKQYQNNIHFQLILGGLSPSPGLPLNTKSRQKIRNHWQHVQAATGIKFNYQFFERQVFVYNSEIPSRAVIAVGRIDEHQALPFMKRLQGAFYSQNIDITDKDKLIELAIDHGINRERYIDEFDSEQCALEVRSNFHIAQKAGITGFPTLFAVDDSGSELISRGYTTTEKVEARMAQWLKVSKVST